MFLKTNKKLVAAAVAATIALVASVPAAEAALLITPTLTSTTTFNNGTYDVYDFVLTGLTGTDTQMGPLGQDAGIISLQGTFTATGTGAMLAVPGVDTTSSRGYYARFITNASSPPTGYGNSFANFGAQQAPSRSGTGTATLSGTTVTAIGGNSASFGSTFFDTDGSVSPNGDNLVAHILVTPGGGVSFSGIYGTYGSNGAPTSFSTGPASPTATPLISLTTAAPTGFGSQLGTLALTGGNGSYRSATVTFATPQTTGYVAVTGFNPGTDTEVYGLRILVNGATPDATTLGTIIGDINATGGNTDTNGTVTAAANTGAFASQFPTSNLLLTTAGTTNGNPFLGFNFANVPGVTGTVTVASISAVPEPTSVAALAVGAVGLLGSRRRAKRTA